MRKSTKKYLKMAVLILVIVLSFQQMVLASSESVRPPKPTIGIESSNPNFGSSKDINMVTPQITGLITDWYCSITNNGSNLYLFGTHTAAYICDELRLTIYLQRWDGSQWIDINSWTYYDYNSPGIANDTLASYQHGNYYRTRAVHYAKYGTKTDTQYSTSPYIYIE